MILLHISLKKIKLVFVKSGLISTNKCVFPVPKDASNAKTFKIVFTVMRKGGTSSTMGSVLVQKGTTTI